MLDMRWKALDRAVNLSQVPAQGDAAFQAFLLRSLRGENARSDLLLAVIPLNRRRWLWAFSTTIRAYRLWHSPKDTQELVH